ncbi:MAG: molybdopterin-dependent oxidoreductase [Planctomycetes bacterium]|nr:molybdopterin-dependent oxidoreductase [Planctomycetota bacterium]
MDDQTTVDEEIVKTQCCLCVGGCGMNIHLNHGKIVSVNGMEEHPHNEGTLCPRGMAVPEYNDSTDRLKTPLLKDGHGWREITWDEALDIIASRLDDIKVKFGANALAVSLGMNMILSGAVTVGVIRRFLDVYGTPNYFTVDSICYRPRVVANTLTFGKVPIPEPENSKCIILWGHNPHASSPITSSRKIQNALKNGANLIVIDPRRIGYAKKADVHAQPRPGTDCALALGLINVIIEEKLYDAQFVAEHTVGFEELAEHVKAYAPDNVSKITWIPEDMIRKIARLFSTVKPSCIVQGVNALDQTTSGFQTARAIAILHAITGSLDVAGGTISISRPRLRSLRLLEIVEDKPLGAQEYPLSYSVFGKLIGEGQGMVLPDAILYEKPYPVKAMIVSGCNMVVSWPNSPKVKNALESLDFLVVMDIFMSETAKMADIVLPAATFLESNDILDHFTYVMLRKKVAQHANCLPDGEFWLRLAHRMGYEEYFPWRNMDEVLGYALEPSGLSLDLLRYEKPEGLDYGSVNYGQYLEKGFRTPSGKVELYSDTMEALGYDPLPVYQEPSQSPLSTPELVQDYPLVLTTGARSLGNLHSQLRNIPKLRKISPEPLADINPATANGAGISNGDWIEVCTPHGVIRIKASVTEDVILGLVSIPHGWAQANVNELTSELGGDPISGIPSLKAGLCNIRKVSSFESDTSAS